MLQTGSNNEVNWLVICVLFNPAPALADREEHISGLTGACLRQKITSDAGPGQARTKGVGFAVALVGVNVAILQRHSLVYGSPYCVQEGRLAAARCILPHLYPSTFRIQVQIDFAFQLENLFAADGQHVGRCGAQRARRELLSICDALPNMQHTFNWSLLKELQMMMHLFNTPTGAPNTAGWPLWQEANRELPFGR